MKEKLFRFSIENQTTFEGIVYTVYLVDKIEGKEGYLGYADYDNKEIVIEQNSMQNMIITFKHELTHVWLEENGYDQNKLFDSENVCEIVAKSNAFINRVTDTFIDCKLRRRRDY